MNPCRNFSLITGLAVLTLMLAISVSTSASPIVFMQVSEDAAGLSREDTVQSAATLMKMLGTMEKACIEGDAGEYADFSDLQDASLISSSETPETFMGGFALHWFFNEDRSDYAIVALPDDPEMIGLMIDSRETVLSIAEYYNDEDMDPWFTPIIEAEETEMADMGSYAFVDMDEINDPQLPLDLLISGDFQKYICAGTQEYGGGINGGMYLSMLEEPYLITDYNPEIGVTVQEINLYAEMLGWESRAKGTLRSLGSTEMAFQGTNDEKVYGGFQDLQDDLYIAAGYTPETMVEGYELLWYLNSDKSDFTVVAMPAGYEDRMGIYMIDSTQVLSKLTPADPAPSDAEWYMLTGWEDGLMGETGEYGWIDPDIAALGGINIDVLLNPEMDGYFLKRMIMNVSDKNVYISETGTFYVREPIL